MISASTPHNRWLSVLFLLALPVFGWLQWQPEAWFDAQLTASGLKANISYAGLDKSFPGLRLSKVSIVLPGGHHFACDEILLRPALSGFIQGSPSLFARAESADISGEVVITQQGGQIRFSDASLNTNASGLSRFDSRLLLLGLQGRLALQGDMLVQAANGLPVDGNLDLIWNNPSSLLLPAGMDRIQIKLSAAVAEGANIWNWEIDSQPDAIAGKGTIVAGGPDILLWLLRGSLTLTNLTLAKGQPELVLSGTLGAPHWQ